MRKDKFWEILTAAGFGAFLAGITDWITNKGDSIVSNFAKILPFFKSESLALFGLVILGLGISWVFKPVTKVDGFVRGLAILTLIGIPSNNILPDDEPTIQEKVVSNYKEEAPLIASLNWTDLSINQSNPDCLPAEGPFKPNAFVDENDWVSSSKPETKIFNADIFVNKCGNALKKGQEVQIINYFETSIKGYYYVQVKFLDNRKKLLKGWIYSGRNPNYWQKIQPMSSHIKPYNFKN